jgi:hypothetical protein
MSRQSTARRALVEYFFTVLLLLTLFAPVHSFTLNPQTHLAQGRLSTTKLDCICINCKRVTNCAAYHFVESKHEQPHMNPSPTWEPRDGSPTIQVNIRSIRTPQDRQAEMDRMWREYKAEESQAKDMHGSTVYDLTPQTTYEYDVIGCADFVEDKGAWIRNMPEEIRQANPHFVPS